MAKPVETRGDQVLEFLGEGMLGTFKLPAEGGAATRVATSVDAQAAARDALARISEMNIARCAADLPTMTLNMSLHLGEVAYGNRGSPTRLDFTAIGLSVNEVLRLKSICDPLKRYLLLSEAFTATTPEDGSILLPTMV